MLTVHSASSGADCLDDAAIRQWGRALATLDQMAKYPWPPRSVIVAAEEYAHGLIADGVQAPSEIHGDTRGCVHLYWQERGPLKGQVVVLAHVEIGRHASRVEAGEDAALSECLGAALEEMSREGWSRAA